MRWANSHYEPKDELAALRHEIGRLSQEYDILNDHYKELQLRGQDQDARIWELEAALEETIEEVKEALPYIIENTPEDELVGWRKRHIDGARDVLGRAAQSGYPYSHLPRRSRGAAGDAH